MKVNNKFIPVLMISLIISTVPALSQTVHYVAAGVDVIETALAGAASGDIIELTTDGGVYQFTDQLVVDIDITIRGAANLIDRPIFKYFGTGTSDPFIEGQGNARIELANIEFDGNATDEGATAAAKYMFYGRSGDPDGSMSLFLEKCYLHDFPDKFIKADSSCGMDSIVVKGNMFMNGAKEAMVLGYNGSSSQPQSPLGYALVENNTFAHFGNEVIVARLCPTTVLRVNHNTMYDAGATGNKPFMYVRDMTDVEIKNTVFVKNYNLDLGEEFVSLTDDATSFHHNIVWDVYNYDIDRCATAHDTLRADPMFAYPANGDFSITAESPAFGFADDGYAAGDLRWDPTAAGGRVWYVEAGEDVIEAAYDMANNGDILELTSSGGVYTFTDQLLLEKDITIRGAATLAEKPVLHYVGTGTSDPFFQPMGANTKIVLQNMVLAADGTASGGTVPAKYGIYARSGIAEGLMNLTIDNCVLFGYADKFFKADTSNGIDSLIITNNVMYDGAKEAMVIGFNGTTSAGTSPVNYVLIENNTIYDIDSEAISAKNDASTVMLVNHNTFYNIGGADNKPMFTLRDMETVEVKNNIFAVGPTTDANEEFMDGDQATQLFHHNVIWDVTEFGVNGCTVSDTINADPQFVDAANADFRLGDISPARLFADDGTAAGDPRWDVASDAVNLSLQTIGEGTLTVDPPGPWYTSGTAIVLTATPAFNWEVSGWSGVSVFPPNAATANLTITENTTVTVTFASLTPQVALDVLPFGYGHVNLSPLPNVENGMYDEGTVVTLTAISDSTDWAFDHWAGDITGTTSPTTVTMDSSIYVEAWFASTLAQYSLDIDTVGLGDIMVTPMPVPGFTTYDAGAVVTLEAFPVPGYEFTGWTGDLTSTGDSVSITMDADKVITGNFAEISFPGHTLEIDTTWDLWDAIQFVNNNSNIDSLLLITSGGVYTSDQETTVRTKVPIVIKGADGLAEKPILTNSNLVSGKDEIIRAFDDLTLENLVMSGSTEHSRGMKYGVRYRHHSDGDSCRNGSDVTFRNVDFKDFFDGGNPAADGHAFKIDGFMRLGNVVVDGCTFTNFGYEALRMSNTENAPALGGCLDSLYVGNTTFTNIDAEGIRYYSLDGVEDPPVLIENCTFNRTATRVLYLKNSEGALVRNLIISNSRNSGVGDRDGELMDAQGEGTIVTHIDTFNVKPVDLKGGDGATIMDAFVWGVDPRYADEANGDYTLTAASHLYGMATDGGALGDLRWATETPTHVTLTIITDDHGTVSSDPMPEGYTYDPGQVITLTAIPDSGYVFQEWSGDASGTNLSVTVEMSGSKSVTATFIPEVGIDPVLPQSYALDQNYPNPFNPTTSIKFALKEAGHTSLTVYDITGRTRAVLADQHMEAGFYEVTFYDPSFSSGLYFYRLNSGKFSAVKKMILVK